MLKFVFGRSGYGKTEYCFKEINRLVSGGQKDILLITPEQYNFTAEKKLLKLLGEGKINCVSNLSFTRLSNEVKRLYGTEPKPVLSKGAKAALMKRAVASVKEELVLFNKKTELASFIESLVDIYDEMRSCRAHSSDFKEVAERVDKKVLADKLCDLNLILGAYENLIKDKYLDSADDLERLCKKLEETGYIKGKYVFIDGFNGFVANEFKVLEHIINNAAETVITLTTDSFANGSDYDLFINVNKTASALLNIAKENSIPVSQISLTENKRTDNKYLRLCEKELYSPSGLTVEEKPDSVFLYSAKNITDECSYTAICIKKLLKQGIRARDITVVCRDADKYSAELACAFKKYEIPFYDDERQDIRMQPLIVFVTYLLRCVMFSFRSDDVLSLAKTGLTALNGEDINSLENYIYLWNISGVKKWGNTFEGSTKGFTSEMSESDRKRLEKINESRGYLFDKINKFKSKIKGSNGADISRAVYEALLSFGVNKNLKNLAGELIDFGKNALAQEQERVWDLLMEILNDIAVVSGEEEISVTEYYELFTLMVGCEDLGVLPQGIDNVQFGQADRLRADNPKAVFVLGANEGEFPRAVSGGGLLSENDRIILSKNDFNLYSFGETLTFQEKYFAYMSTSIARERLYVSYIGNEKNAAPSLIVNSLTDLFKNIEIKASDCVDDIDRVQSSASAFELMAERFNENSTFSASLKEYFKNDTRFNSVRLLCENDDISITNQNNAQRLFGKDMFLSASRLEDYFNCSFRYFCKFGLMAKPLEKADLNAMETGTIIHYVLENIISELGSRSLGTARDVEIKVLVDKYLNKYFETELGNTSELTSRFKYQFMRLSKMLYSVVSRLSEEFSQSEFEAKAFELKIDKDAEVKPQIINLENGTVQIRGAVDRVDVLDKDGERYVRVVDYKSGNKDFKLSDVLHGLNLQMFVYLFTVCRDKSSELCGIPAGILYMHASRSVFSLGRGSTGSELGSKIDKEFKMKGIVLYDESHDILKSMEKDLKGKYIPVKEGKGGITGCFASFEELGRISKKIDSLIAEMGNNLHKGLINQNPINGDGHKHTCEYCDYSYVCANRRAVERNEIDSMSDDEVMEILKEE